MNSINFFKETPFRLNKQLALRKWILKAAKTEGYKIENINYIFCSDKYLRKINKQYLNHDYNTDIITFDNTMPGENLEADIFISVDRVKANAKSYNVSFDNELHRVIIHGLLHLTGYTDKSPKKAEEMRAREDYWLSREVN
ncbi:MAG: rRNA maturation RNase YbeY [Bacteroidia bacterium]